MSAVAYVAVSKRDSGACRKLRLSSVNQIEPHRDRHTHVEVAITMSAVKWLADQTSPPQPSSNFVQCSFRLVDKRSWVANFDFMPTTAPPWPSADMAAANDLWTLCAVRRLENSDSADGAAERGRLG